MSVAPAQARDLAMSAAIYIFENAELTAAFLGASGLRAEDLRRTSGGGHLAQHALDFLLEDDSRVLAAAAALEVHPQDLMAARTVLAGPGSHGWEAD